MRSLTRRPGHDMSDRPPEPAASLTVQPRHVLVVLLGMSGALAVVGLAAELLIAYGALPADIDPLARRFLLDSEGTIPAWYSSMLLLLSGLLLASVIPAMRHQAFRLSILAVIFVLLSADESAQVHEMGTGLMHAAGFADRQNLWVIPGMVFVVAVGIFCLGLLRDLPSPVLRLYVLAAVLFVGGAVGLEVLSHELYPEREGLVYILITTVEESFEMAGASVFVYAQVRLLQERVRSLELSFG